MSVQEGEIIGGVRVATPGPGYQAQAGRGAVQVDQRSEYNKPLIFQAFNEGKVGMEEVAPRGPGNPAPLLVPVAVKPVTQEELVVLQKKSSRKIELPTPAVSSSENLPVFPASSASNGTEQGTFTPCEQRKTHRLVFKTEVGDIPSECYSVYINEELKFITVAMPLVHGYIPKPSLQFTLEFAGQEYQCWSAGLVQVLTEFNLSVVMFAISIPEVEITQ